MPITLRASYYGTSRSTADCERVPICTLLVRNDDATHQIVALKRRTRSSCARLPYTFVLLHFCAQGLAGGWRLRGERRTAPRSRATGRTIAVRSAQRTLPRGRRVGFGRLAHGRCQRNGSRALAPARKTLQVAALRRRGACLPQPSRLPIPDLPPASTHMFPRSVHGQSNAGIGGGVFVRPAEAGGSTPVPVAGLRTPSDGADAQGCASLYATIEMIWFD